MRRWLVGWVALLGGCFDKNPDFMETMTTGEGPGGSTAASPQTDSDPTAAPTSTTGPQPTSETTGATSTPDTEVGTTDLPNTTMTPGQCGDGKLDPGETCDDGNPENTDGCLANCMIAQCGDGQIHAPVEQCDDGNALDSDKCVACKVAMCGDGEVEIGVEACDDGNVMSDDGCESDCQTTRKIVFVSSNQYDGNIGGLLGADQECKKMAQAADLPGWQTFRAWLSTKDESPDGRMNQSAYPYVRVDGVQVAADWTTLVSKPLDNPISLTEHGVTPLMSGQGFCGPTAVHSNTGPDGKPAQAGDCFGWSSVNGETMMGWWDLTDLGWTSACPGICLNKAPIYCFQQ